ncbi:MAG: hypothetical protein IKV94_04510 [Clostridia bacterium]|nr:hypothetical protein [Clostridia bacterium]
MESPASEALIIGMNVFVFVIALTCGVMLMTTVLNMSEVANDIIKDTSTSSLLELYGEGEERLYTGDELLALYQKYTAGTVIAATGGTVPGGFNTAGLQNKYTFYIKREGYGAENLENTEITEEDLKKNFKLEYQGEEDSKLKYLFSEVTT